MTNDATLSFEIFPPKTPAAEATLAETLEALRPLPKLFLSITSGAGGGSAQATADVAHGYGRAVVAPPRPHLTCVQAGRAEMEELVRGYLARGIDRFVALRGDAPAGTERYVPREDGFAYADDLVRALKRWGAGDVAVGGYPEAHPEARSAKHCRDVLAGKLDAGADRILTQYCFDTDALLRWADGLRAAGIEQPIGVGIMPVHNYAQIKRFSDRCGAGVPVWLGEALADLEPGSDLAFERAADIAAEQCRRLVAEGLTHLHFYVLNRSALTLAIVNRLASGPAPVRLAA